MVIAFTGKSKNGQVLENKNGITAPESFYSLTCKDVRGNEVNFNTLKGKSVLIVNSASDCGYTGQYEELQRLHEELRDRLIILAFPSDEFGNQEKGDNEAIAQFCKVNYGVTFPVMAKTKVLKVADQNEVHRWLTSADKNGWNNHAPDWNFGKYLINEKGQLTHYFGPAISPARKILRAAIDASK